MNDTLQSTADALAEIKRAAAEKQLSPGAVENIEKWLGSPGYETYREQIVEHVRKGMWRELDDAFWTVIPFGTGGRRGRMYPIGSATINERTIGESAQGLADYVRQTSAPGDALSCAIAYDTRHRSRQFAELCAEVLVAAGFTVYFLDGHRSTPELSLAVRLKQCSCGVMVTASHNPPSDNAVKVYWSTGCQLLPPHDEGTIDRVMNVERIERAPFADAVASGKVVFCQDEVDAAYVAAVVGQSLGDDRDLKIVYSPLHGVGATAVMPALDGDGFKDVELFAPHAEPNGDFPNVPGHVSNPENPAVFESIIARAKQIGADLVMASDPDCDRIGCAAARSFKPGAEWSTFTGNQIGSLLADYVLRKRSESGRLTPEHYVVKTLVTTELIRRVAENYGAVCYGDLMVGFKWIGGVIDERGPEKFLFGAEESHGYLVGDYARDKDAGVAAMLLAELAAEAKRQGKTLCEKLDALFWQFGCHVERTVSVTMSGSEGMTRMQQLMQQFRADPPRRLGGLPVAAARDYGQNVRLDPSTGKTEPLAGPTGDMVMLDLAEEGNYVAVRPSGTEPKVKFYMFAYQAPELLADLDDARQDLEQRLTAMETDLRAFAGV
jgi:phosphoglucomutase/phosphomannomutase